MATARPRTTSPYGPDGIDPVTGAPWIPNPAGGGDYLNDPVYGQEYAGTTTTNTQDRFPDAPQPTTPPPTTPTDPNRSTPVEPGAALEDGTIYTDPTRPPSTTPTVNYKEGTFRLEGPDNGWGMALTQPVAPPGFEQDKWDASGSLKYRFGREAMKYAPSEDNAAKLIQEAIAAGWDIRPDDTKRTMFWYNNPESGQWEAVRLLSGNNTWEFHFGADAVKGSPPDGVQSTGQPIGPFQPAAPAVPTSDIPWAPNTPYTPPTPAPATPGTAQENEIQTAMREQLLKLLNQPEISAEGLQNDPAVRAQRIQAQRAEERQRAQLMEQNAIEGLADSGAEQTDLAGIRQERSESEAAFIGQLAIQQMQARREEIMQGIQIATQQGQFALGQQLARELAALDAALRREQVQASLADNAAARALQERLAHNQLTQQDRQFLLSLGFSYDELETRANAQATGPITRT